MKNLQEQLADMVESMPAFPTSVKKVIELTADINSNHKDLVKVIEHDPIMTFKILKLVNSPYFGLSREISSINHSVVYMGLNTVKNLAISIASIGMLPNENEAGLNIDKFLYHSVSTATLSHLLSKQLGISNKDNSDFFVTGLLHDFGKIVFSQSLPKEYKKALYLERSNPNRMIEIEKNIMGVDHTQVGMLLSKKWNLSSQLRKAIGFHHTTKSGEYPDNDVLVNIIFITNKLSKELQESENLLSFSKELVRDIKSRFGNDLDKYIEFPEDLRKEIKKALQFLNI